ncbi:MAG: hypothetical protein AB7F86_09580 [Bdellovibrionales bacterium]
MLSHSETALVQPSAGTSGYTQACRAQQDELGCRDFSNDPALKDYVQKCDSADGFLNLDQMIKTCIGSSLGVWAETLKINPHDLIVGSIGAVGQHLAEKAKPEIARKLFYDSCLASEDCMRRMYHAAYGRDPTAEQTKDLAGYKNSWFPSPYTRFDALYTRACGGGLFCNPRDPWFREKLDSVFGTPGRVSPNVVSAAQAFLNQNYSKWMCYNGLGRTQMVCYGLASVLDPLGAAALVRKAPRLAKLLEASKAGALTASRRLATKINDIRAMAKGDPRLTSMMSQLEKLPEASVNRLHATIKDAERVLGPDEARSFMRRWSDEVGLCH